MPYNDTHTIRTRYTGTTYQSICDRSWLRSSSTSGHEQAAFNNCKRQGIPACKLKRLHEKEEGLRDPSRLPHYQWRVYEVVIEFDPAPTT